jgi:hypothetical protein
VKIVLSASKYHSLGLKPFQTNPFENSFIKENNTEKNKFVPFIIFSKTIRTSAF